VEVRLRGDPTFSCTAASLKAHMRNVEMGMNTTEIVGNHFSRGYIAADPNKITSYS